MVHDPNRPQAPSIADLRILKDQLLDFMAANPEAEHHLWNTMLRLVLAIDTVLMNPAEPAIANKWLCDELEAFHAGHC